MKKDYFDADESYIVDVKDIDIKPSISKIKKHYSDEELLNYIDPKKIKEFLNKNKINFS